MWSHLIGRRDVLILDTETTGLHKNSEIVDLAIVDTTGRTVMDVPVMPQGYIPAGAAKVHGLTKARLKALVARPWPDHHGAFLSAIRSAAVVCVYNLAFDMRMLDQTMGRYGLDDEGVVDQVSEICIMLDYARWRRIPHPWRRGDYKWHTLDQAYRHECGRAAQTHRALADCRMVLDLMRTVSAKDAPGRTG